ncbi:MAG: hypothetical protein HFI85_01960 [Clostridia bacterium]|jgi:hypothetical protein|nr:hypothetical protein [Clostridia bacterium]
MEIREILKQEKKQLKRCEHVLTNAKVLYWKNDYKIEKADLTIEENEELVNRIILRHKIGELNKAINGALVQRLQKATLDPKPYMKNYWNEIIEGFANTKNAYTTPTAFQETFLTDKNSKLYRKFPDCLAEGCMQDYIKYLKYYLNSLRQYGHKVAIEKTKSRFANDESMKAYYKQPALPENWADIYKQIQFLKNREKLFDDQNAESENSL